MSGKKEMTESPFPPNDERLQGLRLDILRQAIDCYLTLAYPSGTYPEAVKRRLDWPDGVTAPVLLTGPPFERAGKAPGRQEAIFALRLGNARYPHMKLQIQPWPNEAGFMISVNTHDQVLGLGADAVDSPEFRELQAYNQQLKEAIEQIWDDAGLPTFLRYLRDYIASRADAQPDTMDPEII